ncbi:MAG: DUF4384 domain-containing protein [Rhodobacteraceae bacterium]|nr:DUF4384 domain-containing protein [Paracoccaceae bacterium]
MKMVVKALLVGAAALAPVTAETAGTPEVSPLDWNLKPEQAVARTVTVPQGELSIRLGIGNPRGHYSLGNMLDLSVEKNRDAYVTVLNIGVDGTTTVLYPYLDGTDNLVRAVTAKWISGGDSGGVIRFRAPAGTDLEKAFAPTGRIPLLDPDEITRVTARLGLARSSMFNLVPEMRETIDSNTDVVEWAIDTITVTSVDGPVSVAEDAGQTVSVSEPFGLSIRTGKLACVIGEPVHVAVTPARACKLTVYNIGTSGAVRPEHPVAAGGTVHIPGGDGDLLMASVSPAGGESLVALCASEAATAPGGAEGALIEQLFPRVGEWETLDVHNLPVIATPDDMVPGHGETARAVAAIQVG